MPFQTLGNAPIPAQDRIALGKRPQYQDRPDPQEGKISEPWNDFMTRLTTVVGQSPNRLNSVYLTEQDASIAGTDMSGGNLSAGLYRLTYYFRITQAAGTSSSLAVAFAWADGGVACVLAGAAETGNATSSVQSGTIMVRIDAGSPVNYATTYASVGAPVMEYALDVTLELVKG